MATKKNFYAVRNGRKIGIFKTWEECKEQTDGYSGAEFKGFQNKEDAIRYMKNETESPSENGVIAYVDGSYLHEKKMFSFGAVLFINGEEKQFKAAFSDFELAEMRNVAGEIKGAEFIMKYCVENKIPEVTIFYDYAGIEKWCTGEWKTNKYGTKAYKEVYLECSKSVKIHFHKVKGHSGDKFNDLVDKLAKSALGIE